MGESNSEAVILLHGLRQPRFMLWPMRRRAKASGYQPYLFSYPSHTASLAEHVEHFRTFYEGVAKRHSRISFIAHSLGSIISLTFIKQFSQSEQIKRIVCFGPPLRGAQSARIGQGFFLTRYLFGPSLIDLSKDQFPTLPQGVEIGLIVGGLGNAIGVNPILKGDNDGLVRVEETKTEGAKDAIFMLQTHWLMSSWPSVMNEALHFLEYGRFSERRKRTKDLDGN